MTTRFLLSICAIGLFCASGCTGQKNNAPATDAAPEHIVSASKELTEMVFALGEGHRIVGDDLSSNFPAAADSVPKVGYHRLLSAEGIISLKPDVVIHDGDVAPPKVMESVAQVGIPIKIFPVGRTIDSTELTIRNLAAFLHVPQKGDSLCHVLDSDMSLIKQLHFTDTPRVMIIHFGRVINNYLVMGGHNLATKILNWAGAKNVAPEDANMKPLSAEIIAQAQPDIILATDYGFDRLGTIDKFKTLPGVALTPAAKNGKIYRVEEHDFAYIGPRTGKNILKIAAMLHPNLNIPTEAPAH